MEQEAPIHALSFENHIVIESQERKVKTSDFFLFRITDKLPLCMIKIEKPQAVEK